MFFSSWRDKKQPKLLSCQVSEIRRIPDGACSRLEWYSLKHGQANYSHTHTHTCGRRELPRRFPKDLSRLLTSQEARCLCQHRSASEGVAQVVFIENSIIKLKRLRRYVCCCFPAMANFTLFALCMGVLNEISRPPASTLRCLRFNGKAGISAPRPRKLTMLCTGTSGPPVPASRCRKARELVAWLFTTAQDARLAPGSDILTD